MPLSGDPMAATPEAAEDVSAPVCCGVHAAQNYDI